MRLFLSKEDKQLKRQLQNILGFAPGNIMLYHQAFRHRSVADEIKSGVRNSNERLEYLGDSIIGAIVSAYLFKKYPFKDEGFLTKLRSRIVSRANFNYLSKKIGIDKLINSELDEKASLPSSIHGDAFEAFIGAIFLDKGFKKTNKFVIEIIIKLHLDIDKIAVTDNDFKSKIIEYAQKNKIRARFELKEIVNKGRSSLYAAELFYENHTVTGVGASKKQAEQAAAEKLCLELKLT